MALAAGSNLGPYRIIEPIGRGGMASVFKAYEPSLDRYVALKVLPAEFLHDPSFAERFRREAQTIARLEHPQIIPIFAYDIDLETGTPWMAMRLISGGSLSQRIKRGRLAAPECARILKDVGDALDYAHGAGVIHRDVKPQNVLLDDAGRVYLADFGIAKMIESSAHMTQTGMITGTPQYMAPEQALGKQISKSVDIYALGIVAYELFTGRVPFSADTPVAVLMKQTSEPMPLPPLSEVREEVTRAILRATAKDPAGRWPTAGAFAGAVVSGTTSVESIAATEVMGAIDESAPEAAAPTVVSKAPPAPARRAGLGLAVAAAALVGIALLGAIVTYVGYRYFLSTKQMDVADTATTPTEVPPAPPVETPPTISAPPPAAAETRAPAPTAPAAAPPPSSESSTQARNSALPDRDADRAERLAALAAARRRLLAAAQSEGPASNPTERDRAALPEKRAAGTKINLEVEASQPSTGAQIGALYAQVLIDNQPYREFTIRFTGGNSFARWKRVENLVLEDVPLSAREITLVVATDPGLNSERLEGSTRLALEGEETSLSAVVRFYNRFDKSVRFR